MLLLQRWTTTRKRAGAAPKRGGGTRKRTSEEREGAGGKSGCDSHVDMRERREARGMGDCGSAKRERERCGVGVRSALFIVHFVHRPCTSKKPPTPVSRDSDDKKKKGGKGKGNDKTRQKILNAKKKAASGQHKAA